MATRITEPALAIATSANGVARNGAALVTAFAAPGAIAVTCTANITTSSVLATFKLQASVDGVTFVDISGTSADSSVFASAAGTGSPVATVRILTFPVAAASYTSVRVVATLSGASTGIADVTSADYQYARAGTLI